MQKTSTPPNRAQISAVGRTFSVIYEDKGGKVEVRCAKADLSVQGSSLQQALWNMQRAIEFSLWHRGKTDGVPVRAW